MEYITAQQASKKWGISDRRVRILCAEGKIDSAAKNGKSYQIPADAEKPADGRMRRKRALQAIALTVRLSGSQKTIKMIKDL